MNSFFEQNGARGSQRLADVEPRQAIGFECFMFPYFYVIGCFSSHAQSESAGPKLSWGQAVATLGRPHCQDFSDSGTAKKPDSGASPQRSYGLAPRKCWTCGFTLSVVTKAILNQYRTGVYTYISNAYHSHYDLLLNRFI